MQAESVNPYNPKVYHAAGVDTREAMDCAGHPLRPRPDYLHPDTQRKRDVFRPPMKGSPAIGVVTSRGS
jgi:hypothetical protein